VRLAPPARAGIEVVWSGDPGSVNVARRSCTPLNLPLSRTRPAAGAHVLSWVGSAGRSAELGR
jgi:hypothetical protein